MTNLPPFLDFEASSLSSNSYPIEVAWSRPDGSIESHLISPVGIEGWSDWSLHSEKVHGISRDELLAHGESPELICTRMNLELAGQVVYTDNPIYDGSWLDKLFSVVEGRATQFSLGLVDELLYRELNPTGTRKMAANAQIYEMKKEARRCVGGKHRATLDVQYLIELYKLALEAK